MFFVEVMKSSSEKQGWKSEKIIGSSMKHETCNGVRVSNEIVYYKGSNVHTSLSSSWEELSLAIPLLSKGWYELSLLSVQSRIALVKDIWLNHLSPHASGNGFFDLLEYFFNSLEDIYIYALMNESEIFSDVRMIYFLKHGRGFFQGSPPFLGRMTEFLAQRFNQCFSGGYRAFFSLHDGFSFCDDSGIIPTKHLVRTYDRLRTYLISEESFRSFVTNESCGLIPFYESPGLNEYQCFFSDFELFCGMEDLNVALSDDHRNCVIDCLSGKRKIEKEEGCHYTFLDWLMCYLKDGCNG